MAHLNVHDGHYSLDFEGGEATTATISRKALEGLVERINSYALGSPDEFVQKAPWLVVLEIPGTDSAPMERIHQFPLHEYERAWIACGSLADRIIKAIED